MRLPARRSGGARWIFPILSLLLLAGHVCVLPAHGHSAPAALPAGAGHSHDGGAGDGVHGASCEALRSSWAGSPTVAPSAVTVVDDVVAPCRRWIGRSDAPKAAASSPPLFLLHAALLI